MVSGDHYTSLLDDTVALFSSQTSSNSLGQTIDTWTYFKSGMICRIVPVTAEQRVALPGTFVDVKYLLYFQPSASLSYDWRLKISDDYYKINEFYGDSQGVTQKCYISKVDE